VYVTTDVELQDLNCKICNC